MRLCEPIDPGNPSAAPDALVSQVAQHTTPEKDVAAYCFGPYRLRVVERILECDDELVRVTPKVVDTLLVLLEHAGTVVCKEQLMERVWPDVVVVESGLTRNISVLRQAIEDTGTRYIETIPRRGYRFVGQIMVERPTKTVVPQPICHPVTDTLPTATSPDHPSRTWLVAALVTFLCLVLAGGRPFPTKPPRVRNARASILNALHFLLLAPARRMRALHCL
jgi:DNA-binding winged helix-turn-helix (wHTH) protein